MVGRFVKHNLSGAHSEAARAVLRWSREDLAEVAHVGVSSVRRLELGHIDPSRSLTAGAMQTAFEKTGITFTKNGLEWPAEWSELEEADCDVAT